MNTVNPIYRPETLSTIEEEPDSISDELRQLSPAIQGVFFWNTI